MKKVEAQMDFPKLEREVLTFWKENRIFEKSLEKPARPNGHSGGESPKGEFVFYDGPPFATGLPHYGHLLPGVLKDLFPRYKTMRGYHVPRVWGWDCHGLPIENLVERELGFKSKKDILAYGIEKFNEACRSKVLAFADDWKAYMERFGRFADMEHPYKTMDPEYMESVWAVFKELWEKELIYESYRTMYICPRCETTLSQQEVSEGYKDVKDLAVTAMFELADEPGTYLLAWTTTPWTLPGNVALAVNKDIQYSQVVCEDKKYIVASALVESVFAEKEHQVEKSFPGAELLGKSYRAPFDDYQKQTSLENYENGWKVYHADFVTTDMGTGIAHEAPAFGEEDMALGKQEQLPWVQHVNLDGTVKPDVAEFAGMQVKPLEDPQAFDVEIIKALAKKNLLFAKEKYEHSYPHCWRCDTPLLNYATSSWFVKIEGAVKERALKNAQEIQWSPEHIKTGRFGKWLEGARDWSISRQRFWATPIPIWQCSCGEQVVIGSRKELEEQGGKKIEDLHKHFVDAITFPCAKCEGEMQRIPDVLDTWFDSGSMPYASQHYLFEGSTLEHFPANFIAEGVDQTRAWFYYLHILANALLGQNAFQQAVVNGVVLAEDGKKMSKKLQNYPDPMAVIDKYGADALRLYLLSSPAVAAENLNFSEHDLDSITKNAFRMLWNSYSFFTTYATIDNWEPKEGDSSDNLLDRWILSELGLLVEEMTDALDNFQPAQAARLITPFIDNLSNWYIRRSRKRFWKPARELKGGGNENDSDKNQAYQTLYTVLVELSKLMAPFTPFIAEEIYRNLTQLRQGSDGQAGEESVHLAAWPEVVESDFNVREQMNIVREVVTYGLQKRSELGVKVRQPLQSVSIRFNSSPEFREIVKDELNVKEVSVNQNQENWVEFDSHITPELKLEGQAREIIRALQEGRKKAGFNVEDRITVGYQGMSEVFAKHQADIASEVLAEGGAEPHELEEAEYSDTVDLDGEKLSFWLKRV